jgi:alpha-D-ribose 1-methylphosphonate 5-triphosphate synthase subunit PhnG
MTATPLTSVLDRVANVFIVLGARYAPMRNSGALACAREVLAEMVEAHVGGGEQVFEGQDTALADLKALIAQVCVGFDSICGDDAETSAAVDALIQRLGIERKVICYKADCPRTELVKKLVEGAKPGQKSKALECHELAPRMSFALHGSNELEADWLARKQPLRPQSLTH